MLTVNEIRALCAVAGVRCNVKNNIESRIALPYICEIDDFLYVGFGKTEDEAIQKAWETYVNSQRD